MAERTVFCVKLHKELPGLDEPPFDTEFGKKIYENVSQQAWQGWTEFCKMLLNEYRLNPARREDQEAIVKQMEQYFFGEGAAPPKEYVPAEIAQSKDRQQLLTLAPLSPTVTMRLLPWWIHVYRIVTFISSSRNIPAARNKVWIRPSTIR